MSKIYTWVSVTTLAVVGAVEYSLAADVRSSQTVIRMIMFTLAVIGCGLFVGVAWHRPERRWLFVAPISWMVNLGAFYLCRLAGWPANVMAVNMWSQVIQLHALILLIGGLLLYEHK